MNDFSLDQLQVIDVDIADATTPVALLAAGAAGVVRRVWRMILTINDQVLATIVDANGTWILQKYQGSFMDKEGADIPFLKSAAATAITIETDTIQRITARIWFDEGA